MSVPHKLGPLTKNCMFFCITSKVSHQIVLPLPRYWQSWKAWEGRRTTPVLMCDILHIPGIQFENINEVYN